MYLKALEIQGFKSFPEKTVLEFGHNITAIVGPNGSGKSNISDALRWVMGEQSTKNLRGGKMEDVIFGGTEKRSPVGFAQVTLVIDNSGNIFDMENAEVSITRRYYRSGESEYYINRQAVRLRDINELLMDTGLGRDGYSIIGQGRIDEILSVRSTDRREIFEEAAGISRYRYRKEEAERKLEHTGDSLVRINDKISELEMQVEPLRKQSETAKKYLILRDELRGIEISVWCENIDRLRAQTIKTQTDFEENKRRLEEERSIVEQLYSSADIIGGQMKDIDVKAEALRGLITSSESETASIESAIAVCLANIHSLEENISRINEEIGEQENRAEDIRAQISEHRLRIAEAEKKQKELDEQGLALIDETSGLYESQSSSASELGELLRQEAEELSAVSEQKNRLSALVSGANERSKREISITEELARSRDKFQKEKENLSKSLEELEGATEAAKSAENVIKGYELRLQSKKAKVSELADKKTKLTIECGNFSSRIVMLQEMEREYQGFSNAVKTVMRESERGTIRGIHGPVANLVKAENKYALAVETALGASMQSIIVTSDEDGKAAINMLKRRDSGRGTFLPMSTMKGNVLGENEVRREEGFEGIASELVSFDEQYRGIYTYLLGRTVVAEDLDSAVRLGRKYSNRFRIVTLDGQVVNAGGSMTGGSTAKNTGIISRANELEALREKQIAADKQLADLQYEFLQAEREMNVALDGFEGAKGELRIAQDDILRLRTESEHLKLLIKSIDENIKDMSSEAELINQRKVQDESEKAEISAQMESHQSKADSFRAKADMLSKGRDELRERGDRLTEKLAAIREVSASLDAERTARISAAADLERLCESISGDAGKRQEKVAEFKAQIKTLEAETEKNTALESESTERTNALRAELTALIDERLALEAEQTKSLKTGRERDNGLRELEREGSRLEQKKLTAELEEKQLTDKLWENYELSVTAAQAARTELESMQKATRRINELRREINALGTPNIGAIDEFERVNTRYTFLTEQRDDVEKSKSELENIIRDITAEMKAIFQKEFCIINQSFRETFLELFGGGKAELMLEDENDVLNCGIEIKVQPPGKSLKTITLLSGGEKAFVAIAIYFAILKVRPTPFCVMDEIEAALDDANVLRFAKYLHSFSDKTQFLIITHRRGTMEGADELFGVTMQEHGVSKVLSVDLKEAEKSIAE